MAHVKIVEGPDTGRTYSLTSKAITVGRGESNAIRLTDLTVSRVHFRIVPHAHGWLVIDLGSRNQTRVNDLPADRHLLANHDRISVGSTRLQFVVEPPSEPSERIRAHRSETVTFELRGLAALDRHIHRLASVYRVAEVISAIDTIDALHEATARVLTDELSAVQVTVFAQHPDGVVEAMACQSTQPGGSHAAGTGLPARAIAEATSLLVEVGDAEGDGWSILCAPMVSRGRAVGAIRADRPMRDGAFVQTDLQFLTAAGQQAGMAIENLQQRGRLAAENSLLLARVRDEHQLIGTSQPIRALRAFLTKVAPTDSTVLLTGESGTGKEMVAMTLHDMSPRRLAPFVVVNCAALTETLLESELFGHEKGAFTGATRRKMGRFEIADGGTLFLDEVGELSPSAQLRFLRVLERNSFHRVGGNQPVSVDVRVLAATNRNLERAVKRGLFRRDLYYRLKVIHRELPTLRARRSDVELLANHFASGHAAKMGRRVEPISVGTATALAGYDWPGNVRELKNTVERALVLGDGDTLTNADFVLAGHESVQAGSDSDIFPGEMGTLRLVDLERWAIVHSLQRTEGNKMRAAELLGIDRSTLYKKLRTYGLDL